MSAGKLRDIMPKELGDQLTDIYLRLQEVPYIKKQEMEKWQERFCYSPEPEREAAIWEWLADEYENRTDGVQGQEEKNRIFKKLLTESVDFEPLGVRKLPE